MAFGVVPEPIGAIQKPFALTLTKLAARPYFFGLSP
jgi:hypothetical protein